MRGYIMLIAAGEESRPKRKEIIATKAFGCNKASSFNSSYKVGGKRRHWRHGVWVNATETEGNRGEMHEWMKREGFWIALGWVWVFGSGYREPGNWENSAWGGTEDWQKRSKTFARWRHNNKRL